MEQTKATTEQNATFLKFYDVDKKENFTYTVSVPALKEDGTPHLDANGKAIVSKVTIERYFSAKKDSEHVVFNLGEKKIWVGARADKLKRVYALVQKPKEESSDTNIEL